MLELLVQAEGRPAVKLDGVVDSGATHTMLSLQPLICSAGPAR